MENKHHFERIVGGNAEQKEKAQKKLQELFDAPSSNLKKYEIEKTPEDKFILSTTLDMVDGMVKQYGGNPKSFSLDKIIVVNPGDIEKATEGRFGSGLHQVMSSNIGIEKGKSKLGFASTVAHELFHLKSYKSALIRKPSEGVKLYRSGLTMIDRNTKIGEEKGYFSKLEEAIVAECTKRFLNKMKENPMFAEEVKPLEIFKSWTFAYLREQGIPEAIIIMAGDEIKYVPNIQKRVEEVISFSKDEKERASYAMGMLHALIADNKIELLERGTERNMLYSLLDEILEKSGNKFKNRDELFDEFAKANFSGNYIGIARIIEDSLGHGAFRRIADKFSITPAKASSGRIWSRIKKIFKQ